MRTLPEILGIDRRDGTADLSAIMTVLQETGPTIPCVTWASVARVLFVTYIDKWPQNEAEEDDYTFMAFVEIFSSNAWREYARRFCVVRVLGYEDSETPRDSEFEAWLHSGYWARVAMSAEYTLYSHAAQGGTLFRLNFADEGFDENYWLFAEEAAK